jgi:DNA-binding NarL/FixJ family response regulator
LRQLKIVIADGHRLMLSALRLVIEADPGFQWVGEASDGAEVLPLVGRTQPDVVLLDLKLPRVDGLACLEHLRKRHPSVRGAILSSIDDPAIVQAAFRHGACAFILKHIDPTDLPGAIRQAMEGTVYQPFRGHTEGVMPGVTAAGLTDRELGILSLVADGKSNKQIAAELHLAVQTVKFHLTSLYRKLNTSTRTEAVREAYALGLLEAPLLQRVS